MELIYEFCESNKIFFTIAHVIGVIIAMGSALVSDLLFSFYGHDKKLSQSETKTLNLLSTVVWGGLVVITISGLGLFLSDHVRYLASVKFMVKMSIMIVLVLNGYVLHRYVSKKMIKRGFLSNHKFTGIRKVAFACGAISVISWFSVCILGILSSVPLSYGIMMGMYGAIILAGIIIALIVEQKTFE